MAKPKSTVSTEIIPYIFYRDVPAALDWLTRAFGFAETMRTATPNGGTHGEMTLDGQRNGCCSLINRVTVLTMDLLTTQHLVSGANIGIGGWFVLEILAPEQTAVALVVDRAHRWDVRQHPCRFAACRLFSIGVACVGHDVKTIDTDRLLCCLSHWL